MANKGLPGQLSKYVIATVESINSGNQFYWIKKGLKLEAGKFLQLGMGGKKWEDILKLLFKQLIQKYKTRSGMATNPTSSITLITWQKYCWCSFKYKCITGGGCFKS